jgi:hypothetical protein
MKNYFELLVKEKKSTPLKPIGLWDVEATHFQENRLTDGGDVVSLTRRPPFTSREDPWCS